MKSNTTGPKKAKFVNTENFCDYGCGQQAKFLNLSGKYMCSSTSHQCPSVKSRNSAGGKKSYEDGKRKDAKRVYEQLSQDIKDKMNWNKGNYSKTEFVYAGKGNHKLALIVERGHECEECKLTEWNSKSIPLELEHCDGDNKNNTRVNLKLLCCNCHAQTDTWRGRNVNTGKIKVSDDEILTALKECSNIRQALIKVGLTPKGRNYDRVNKLIHGGVVKLANTSDLSSDASA